MSKRTKNRNRRVLLKMNILNRVLKDLMRIDEYRNVPEDIQAFQDRFIKKIACVFQVPESMLRGDIPPRT